MRRRAYTISIIWGKTPGETAFCSRFSMSEREYGLYYYGDKSAEVFTDSALQEIEDAFLNRFGEDDWAGGFEDYKVLRKLY